MNLLQKIRPIVFLGFLFITTFSFAQKSTNQNVGYMGKRFIVNTYTNINILPFSEYHVPYNENGLFTGVYAALNLEGEYILNRRFGFTLGTMRHRLGVNYIDFEEMPNVDIQRVKVRTLSFGIKNYLRREGGLAPVGFYQHLRYQFAFGNRQGFNLKDGEYRKASEKLDFSDEIISYGAGKNFGFGGLPLFSLGAEIMVPISFLSYDSSINDGLVVLLFNVRMGIVLPLF